MEILCSLVGVGLEANKSVQQPRRSEEILDRGARLRKWTHRRENTGPDARGRDIERRVELAKSVHGERLARDLRWECGVLNGSSGESPVFGVSGPSAS